MPLKWCSGYAWSPWGDFGLKFDWAHFSLVAWFFQMVHSSTVNSFSIRGDSHKVRPIESIVNNTSKSNQEF